MKIMGGVFLSSQTTMTDITNKHYTQIPHFSDNFYNIVIYYDILLS